MTPMTTITTQCMTTSELLEAFRANKEALTELHADLDAAYAHADYAERVSECRLLAREMRRRGLLG